MRTDIDYVCPHLGIFPTHDTLSTSLGYEFVLQNYDPTVFDTFLLFRKAPFFKGTTLDINDISQFISHTVSLRNADRTRLTMFQLIMN